MQLPKFILGDNECFKFVINNEEDEKELSAETENMIKLASEFYDREISMYEE